MAVAHSWAVWLHIREHGLDSQSERDEGSDRRLPAFIRRHRAAILERWEQVVRQLPIARVLDRPALIDHLPQLLDRIASMADDQLDEKRPKISPDLAEVH